MTDEKEVVVSLCIYKKQNHRYVGAAVLKGKTIELFEFVENDQLFNIDQLLLQIGPCVLYLPDELEEKKGDGKKIQNIMYGRDLEVLFLKKILFKKFEDNKKIQFEDSNILTLCEIDYTLSLTCLSCLVHTQRLEDLSSNNVYKIKCCTLNNFMRLDSAAAEAVNLLPKPDHPSQYGSILGVLNRTKTKMGARLLERWLRQPLVDVGEITNRQDIVEVLLRSAVYRNQLTENLLKSIPDLDGIVQKMAGKRAGLKEIVALWSFTNILPKILQVCQGICDSEDSDSTSFRERIVDRLSSVADKFEVYQRLVEHVVDLRRLPELVVSCKHDADLQELIDELEDLHSQAEEIHKVANATWASFTDLRLERHSIYGYILRSPRCEDEREFQKNKTKVVIVSIKKNGVYCSTSALQSISNRVLEIDRIYQSKQEVVVEKALETALTYLPVAETSAAIVAELDVLTSFSTVAALSPEGYVRPTIHPKGQGVIDFKKARHPCVELMDNMQFIPNDYELRRGLNNFQLVTGPNMGGKSTYIRGVGSIVVMAQVGSYVPCESAELSIIDCILARVGAGDAVQKGVSTFMAEMLEASVILETSTSDSLVVIDELGRGTSTFDGFGIARAISEYIITEKKCPCLFATHFHDLTSLEQTHSGVQNKHVSVHLDATNQMTMLYDVQQGPCTQSYGIYVAMAAGFPSEAIKVSKRKAEELENESGLWNTDEGRAKHAQIAASMKSFADMPLEGISEKSALQEALQKLGLPCF